MPYPMADFRRHYVKEHLKELTPEERLEGLPVEEIVKVLLPEELLKALSAKAIEQYLKRLQAKTDPRKPPSSADQSSRAQRGAGLAPQKKARAG